jgi:hypothetical protein
MLGFGFQQPVDARPADTGAWCVTTLVRPHCLALQDRLALPQRPNDGCVDDEITKLPVIRAVLGRQAPASQMPWRAGPDTGV